MSGIKQTRRFFTQSFTGTALAGAAVLRGQSFASTRVGNDDISYLMADAAARTGSFQVHHEANPSDPKRFWVQGWHEPSQVFEWLLDVASAGGYEMTLMVSAPPGTRIRLVGPKNSVFCETTWLSKPNATFHWDRVRVSTPLILPAGPSKLRVQLEGSVGGKVGAALKSIELVDLRRRAALDSRVKAFRSDATWLGKAKMGFMCQCGEWSYPPKGPHKPWPQMVDNFDVDRFASLVESTGAGYAIWSATWATYFFPAPIKAIDAILPGRTSQRDLIGDIANALAKRDIRLILYYHVGHDPAPGNAGWWAHNWRSPEDKTLFFDNWCAIVTEVGERYKERLAGWMFDDDLVYYPAPYERLGKAAKAGSVARIVSYNPWIQARGTEFQDFQFGEGYTGDERLAVGGNGIWTVGPMKGLQAHGNFQVDGPDWGIHHEHTVVEAPHFTKEKAIAFALDAASRNEALSWNLLMFDDGSVAPASLALLREVGRAVRAKYPRKETP